MQSFSGVVWLLWRVLEKAGVFLSSLVEVLWVLAVPVLFTGLYSYLVMYCMVLAASFGWGVYVWGVPVVMLTPVVVVWFRVLQKRYREYLAVLMASHPVHWDIDAAVKGWTALVKDKKSTEKKRA